MRFSWYFSLRLYRFFTSTLGFGFPGALAAVLDAGGVKNPVSTLTSRDHNEDFDFVSQGLL